MKNKNSSENLTNLTTEMHIGYWTVVTNLKYFYIVSQKKLPRNFIKWLLIFKILPPTDSIVNMQ